MLHLLATSAVQLEWFDGRWQNLERFLAEHGLDGLEVYLPVLSPEQQRQMPPSLVRGMHCSYWFNTWMDHWRQGDYSHESCAVMIDTLQRELDEAERLQVDHVVLHAGYADYADVLTHLYPYANIAVLDTIAETVNKVLAGRRPLFEVLLENVPVPGLTLTDPFLVPYLLNQVEHPLKGLMLDTGHVMNCNLALRDESQAIEYVRNTVETLGEYRPLVRGMHLQRSLAWEFMVSDRRRRLVKRYMEAVDDEERGMLSWEITCETDQHRAFVESAARDLVEYVAPRRVVYEFIPRSYEDLVGLVRSQNAALGRAQPDPVGRSAPRDTFRH